MLKLYNTLTRKKESFKPLKNKKVNLFVCGITPYDFAHIGHARTYLAFDMIVKYLKEKSYDVFYLQNITDIDDKIINRAKEKDISPQKLARDFEKEYLEDMKNLKINSVTKYARATEHIKEIIGQVGWLLKKSYAYKIEDGIYYDISKFKDYGKLSRRTVLQAEDAVSRIDEAKEKRNRGDFCLWKFSKPNEPKWKSPDGDGRPGWHIEDTAITEKYFGPQYDIHGGANELIFPHHEAEIAQMEAISTKKPLVKYWLHTGLLTVGKVKMSKSLKNFITIKDFLKKHPARILRLFVLKTHYRSPIDYNEKKIEQVKKELERIDEFLDKLVRASKVSKNSRLRKFGQNLNLKKQKGAEVLVAKTQKEFERAMDDDFNTPKAMAVIFELINKGNSLIGKNKLTQNEAQNILEFLKKVDKVFNFIFWRGRYVYGKATLKGAGYLYAKATIIPSFIKKMVMEREEARKSGNWKLADEIRQKIRQMDYWIEDTKEGPKIKKIS